MRKLLMGAVAASASLAVVAGAIAQTPESTFKAKVSPSDAGTPTKPKNTTLNFNVTLDKPNTTVEFIDLALPRGLKMSGKGLKRCTVDTLAAEGPARLPGGSKAGPTGSATADLGPEGPAQSKLVFQVSPFVLDANTLVFYVASENGSGVVVQSPITGEITDQGPQAADHDPEGAAPAGPVHRRVAHRRSTRRSRARSARSTSCRASAASSASTSSRAS